ncbi:MAG TPA: hypothetical protein VII73_14165 [Caulobacteraceae bacterium]
MAELLGLDAAFTGFRIVREHPRAAALWALLSVVSSVLFSLFIAATAGPAFTEMMSLRAGNDPRAVALLMAQLWPVLGGALVVVFAVYSIVLAAVNRAVSTPDDDRFGYMRLGLEELRQMGLMFMLLVMALALYILTVVAAVVIGLIVGPSGRTAAMALTLVVGLIGALVYFGVRLSLASPLTFAAGKVRLARSWAMTRGRFWSMLGIYGLTAALGLTVWFLGFAVISAGVALAGGGADALSVIARPDFSSIAATMSPPRLTYLVLQSALSGLLWPLALSPPIAICRALAAGSGVQR